MTAPIEFSFDRPGPLLSMNDRHHWTRDRADAKAWRTGAAWGALAAGIRKAPPCTVTITLPVKGNLRRDPHNYFKTIKPLIDGLVDAGVWPDDTPAYVTTTEPRLDPNTTRVTVLLVPR